MTNVIIFATSEYIREITLEIGQTIITLHLFPLVYFGYCLSCLDPFPNPDAFERICRRNLLKTLWKRGEIVHD